MGIQFAHDTHVDTIDFIRRDSTSTGVYSYPAECVAKSRSMQGALKKMERILSESNRIVFTGPSGVGKKFLARRYHFRKGLPSESILFFDVRREIDGDYEKAGAFLFGQMSLTFFRREELKPGLLAKCEGGTLVLENFELLPPDVQRSIEGFLTHGIYYPVGSSFPKRGCVNLVFASALSLPRLLKGGRITRGLYDLLKDCWVELKPLKERKDDIIPLAELFVRLWSDCLNIPRKGISKGAASFLKRAPWSGNASELKRVILEAILFSKGDTIEASHISLVHDGNLYSHVSARLEGVSLEEVVEKKLSLFLERLGKYEVENLYDTVISRVERPLLRKVLEKTKGNQLRAARILGINRNTLRARIKKLDIKL